MDDFDEYIRQVEPGKRAKGAIWETAIGLQQVDGLEPSGYLIENAKQNIEGDITIDEVKRRLDSYYEQQISRAPEDDRTEEADKVSARITEMLSEQTFSFTPAEYINIHGRLFADIYTHAGTIRDYNITKKEWVLNGETVLYAGADSIIPALEYDFDQERDFDYRGLSQYEKVQHIAAFTSSIWQIHPFAEGNTRTAAVFLIKYLHKLGYTDINNDSFATHSWYFRNALVRANYENIARNIHTDNSYLLRFFENLLLGGTHELRNRHIHLQYQGDTVKQQNDTANATNDTVFNLIQDDPDITAEEIRLKLGISIATAKRRIKQLKDEGKIRRVGSDKTGRWEVCGE